MSDRLNKALNRLLHREVTEALEDEVARARGVRADVLKEGSTAEFVITRPIGSYTVIEANKKPAWFHRKMIKLILGWTWNDA